MDITFLTFKDENDPASRYRGYFFSKKLEKLGFHTRLNPIGIKRYCFNLFLEFLELFNFKHRVIYIQRMANPIIRFLSSLYKLEGNKIIFDFDDAIFTKNNKKVSSMIKIANAIVAGNSYLADYAKKYNKNVHIIPTSIDLETIGKLRKDYLKDNKKIIIGWIGSISTLKYLEEIRKPLEDLSKKYKLELRIIGPVNSIEKLNDFNSIPIKLIPWKLETEWEELSKIDIGIMPLFNDKYTKGKCALKLLQYMALEIPAVGSNVGANKEVIINGKTGFLPKSKKEWENYLERLINDKNLRRNIGKAGRKTIEERYSLEKNARKLVDIINSLVN